MSYILDALKKAEAERDPDVRTGLAIEQGERHRHRLLIYGVIAALLTNAVVLIWLFFPDPQLPESVPSQAPSASERRPETVAVPVVDPVGRAVVPPEQQPVSPLPSVSEAESIAFAALPEDVAARLPVLEFSTHIFAEDPGLRVLVVNGQRIHEGDQIGAVTFTEITEDGAILAFDRYLITIPVLQNWD
jgi:hypothetical protein